MTRKSLFKRIIRIVKRDLLPFSPAYRPVFICGVHGSGTTYLSSLLLSNLAVTGLANESALRIGKTSPLKIAPSKIFSSSADFFEALFLPTDVSPDRVRADIIRFYRGEMPLYSVSKIVIDNAPNAHLVRARKLKLAFPAAKFILIYRDSISNVEGMKRKWELFQRGDLSEAYNFWCQCNEEFLKQTSTFTEDILGISYEYLVQNEGEIVEFVSDWLSVPILRKKRRLADTGNRPGFGVRNIEGGELKTITNANKFAIANLDPDEYQLIDDHTRETRTSLQNDTIAVKNFHY